MVRNPVADAMESAGYRSIGIWRELDAKPIARELSLRRPLVIIPMRWTAAPGERVGRHSEQGGAHLIYISTYLNPQRAREVLRHECKHAQQSEQNPNFAKAYAVQELVNGYTNNRFEQEARRYATHT